MPDTLLFEWTFEPPGMFEEKTVLHAAGFEFTIDAGRAQCHIVIDSDVGNDWRGLQTEVHETLNSMFRAALMQSHEPYTLSKPTLSRIGQSGAILRFASADPIKLSLRGGRADFIVKNGDGTVVRDSKRERITERNELAQVAAAQITHPVASSVLRSYSAAVKDPANELVHLFEIREALAAHFGSAAAAQQATNISSTKWSTLGRLANDEPLIQGRHRGKHPGTLRDATAEELREARAIAREMIEAYLRAL